MTCGGHLSVNTGADARSRLPREQFSAETSYEAFTWAQSL